MSKRGIFFSIMSILLSALIILIFSSASSASIDERALVAAERADYVDSLVEDMGSYLGVQSQYATAEALEALIDSYVKDGFYIPGTAITQLEQCLLEGNFSGRTTDSCDTMNASLDESLRTVQGDGLFDILENQYTRLTITHAIEDISVEQESTYQLLVNISMIVNISADDAAWSRRLQIVESVSLVGVTDPATAGMPYNRTIKLRDDSLGTIFLIEGQGNDFDLFANLSTRGVVFRDTSAPSFFQVLEGNLPSNVSTGFDQWGFASIIPAHVAGSSQYIDNRTSFISYTRTLFSPMDFDPINLTRINHTDMNTNITLPTDYIDNVTQGLLSNPQYYNVSGCCDDDGCIPMCQ